MVARPGYQFTNPNCLSLKLIVTPLDSIMMQLSQVNNVASYKYS